MNTLKEVALKVGDTLSQLTETKPSEGEGAQKDPQESDKVETGGKPDLTDLYGTHPEEKASKLVSNLEKLGNKPADA